jgi:hypothetical protein
VTIKRLTQLHLPRNIYVIKNHITILMQEHHQLIKRANAEAEDSWTSQHKFLKML